MKTLILFLIALAAQADEYYRAITPYGVPDMSSPGILVKENVIYQTIPSTSLIDYSGKAYRVEGDTIYPAHPMGGLRDFSGGPGYRLQRNIVDELPGAPRLHLPGIE